MGTAVVLKKPLSAEDVAFLQRVMSATAFGWIVEDRLLTKCGLSIVRMADGERAFIMFCKGSRLPAQLRTEKWQKQYGLWGADLRAVGEGLLRAARSAEFLALSLSGVYHPRYRLHDLVEARERYVDFQYFRLWHVSERLQRILSAASSVLVLQRNAAYVAQRLRIRLGLRKVESFRLDSWQDQPRAEEAVASSPAPLVLVSGGPFYKPYCVEWATRYNKVVLDVGGALDWLLSRI